MAKPKYKKLVEKYAEDIENIKKLRGQSKELFAEGSEAAKDFHPYDDKPNWDAHKESE